MISCRTILTSAGFAPAHGAEWGLWKTVAQGRNPAEVGYKAMKAYNIDVLSRPATRSTDQDHGWCFGLPPGISPEQWPLDPHNGYPLMHGFTLLLPEDYRDIKFDWACN